MTLLLRDDLFVGPVALVADQNLVDALARVLLDVRVPRSNVFFFFLPTKKKSVSPRKKIERARALGKLTVETPLVRHVVHEENSHRASVVSSRDRPETFLSRRIPLRRAEKKRGKGQ